MKTRRFWGVFGASTLIGASTGLALGLTGLLSVVLAALAGGALAAATFWVWYR